MYPIKADVKSGALERQLLLEAIYKNNSNTLHFPPDRIINIILQHIFIFEHTNRTKLNVNRFFRICWKKHDRVTDILFYVFGQHSYLYYFDRWRRHEKHDARHHLHSASIGFWLKLCATKTVLQIQCMYNHI